jgi:hypothetical protein
VVGAAVVGDGRGVELVFERATRVLVAPEPARDDGFPAHEAATRPNAAQSTAASAARTARVDPRCSPADVISPPGGA